MKALIDLLITILTTIIKGVFDALIFIFQIDTNERLYEDAEMTGSDKRKLFSRWNKGLVINGEKRITVQQSLTHTVMVGKSGIGKTSVGFLPNLLKAKNQNYVVTDLDGAIFKASSGYLKQQGYDIQVLDFNEVTKSLHFNPLDFCETTDELKGLAEQIVFSSSASQGSKDQFWNYSSSHLLFFLLRLVKTQAKEFQNLSNVRHLLSLMETNGFQKFVTENAEGVLFADYLSFHSKDSKLRTNIQASLSATMDLFTYAEIAHITAFNSLDLERLLHPKAVLFLIIPEVKLRKFSLILSLFYGVLFEFFQKNRPKKPITFLLDECGNYFIKDFSILLTILRRYNCVLFLGVQAISQIRSLYGQNGCATILSNISTKIIFPGGSLELATSISKMSGQKSVEILFEGTLKQQIKPVLSITDIIQLKKNRVLVLCAGFPPIILKAFPYFRQFFLKRRAKLQPVERKENNLIMPCLIPLIPNEYET